jgi:hypothetical protein
MAIDYTPQGRRVALDTPGSRGFSPVQAADNSQNVLRQGQVALDSFAKAQEFKLANSARDLEALTTLSKTASEFLVDRQKGINENDRKLGIADILNGDMQPKPAARQTYLENAEQLKTAAQGEQQALNTLQKTQPVQALEIRANDPVVNAWRSYGQAQGVAMRAAYSASTLLSQAMASTEATIPLTDAQGNTRMIAPSNPRTPSELNAVWAVVLQGFIGASGLDGINPILLSELVTPRIMEIKSQIFDQQYTRMAKAQAAEAKDHTLTVLANAITRTNLQDPVAINGLLQDGAIALMDNVGMARGEANELMYDRLLQAAADVDAVTAIESTPIAADGSNARSTLGVRFPEKAQAAREKIINQNETDAARRKAADKVAVEDVVNKYNLEILNLSPDEAAKRHDLAAQILRQMVEDEKDGASNALVEHMAKPRRRAGQAYLAAIIQKQIATPGFYSREQIQKEIANGVLPPGFDSRLEYPSDALAPTLKGWEKRANAAARGYFIDRMGSFKPTDIEGGQVSTRQNHMADALMDGLRKGLAQSLAQGKDFDPDRFIEDQIKVLATKPWYQFKPERSDKPGFPVEFVAPLRPNEVSVNIGTNGRSTFTDYSTIPSINFKDLTVRPKDQILGTDTLKELQEGYKRTNSLPSEVLPAVRSTGLTQAEFIRVQSGAPRGLAGLEARAQGLQQGILDNPRSTSLEQLGARYQIERKQLLLQNQPLAPGAISPETADLLQDQGKKEGGARGYEAANKGGAGDLPGGVPGLTGMTINQILARGDLHHVGMHQLQLGKGRTLDSLKTRMGLTGNEKFTPELQDRMAAELIWGGWKRPALTTYLKGGGNLEKAVADYNEEWQIGKQGFNVRPYLLKMRAAYQVRGAGAVGQAANFSKANVTSISYERKGRGDSYQPGGVDIYFRDKQFPALLPGKVIETGNQPGGYGLWVVTEHVDPQTGQTFQLINAHMDAIHVKEGQTINVGTVLGRQGSTGTTSAGGITSIDPIMPAPKGSRAQVPYIRPGLLKELLTNLIR